MHCKSSVGTSWYRIAVLTVLVLAWLLGTGAALSFGQGFYNPGTPATLPSSVYGRARLQDADAAADLTGQGWSAWMQAGKAKANAGAWLTYEGWGAFLQTRKGDANAGAFLTGAGFSAWLQTWLNVADANALRPYLRLGVVNVQDAAYLAKGDGTTDDTASVRAAIADLPAVGGCLYFPPGVYLVDYLQIEGKSNLAIHGTHAVLRKLPTAATHWYGQSGMITLLACRNVTVEGLEFDGNYANLDLANVGWSGAITVCPDVPDGSDFRANTGGESKTSRNVTIRNCYFHDTGTPGYAAVPHDDAFGDGVYAFGVDGLRVEGCKFQAMGRWGVAFSDCLNVAIVDNDCNNPASSKARGFVDNEQESSDATNGTYSRHVMVAGNRGVGKCKIYVQALNAASNAAGANHYVRDVVIADNDLRLWYAATVSTSAIGLVAAPAVTAVPTDLSRVTIRGNRIGKAVGSANMTSGISIYPTGPTATTDTFLADIVIERNTIRDATNGIYSHGGRPGIFTRVRVEGNTIAAGVSTAGAGIDLLSEYYAGIDVLNNYVIDYATNGIKVTSNNSGASWGCIGYNEIHDGAAAGITVAVYTDILAPNIDLVHNRIEQSGGADYYASNNATYLLSYAGGVERTSKGKFLGTVTVIKTIDIRNAGGTGDYHFNNTVGDAVKQTLTLTNILPAYALLTNFQVRCYETVTGSAAMQIDLGTTSGGTEIATGSPDTANDILGTIAGDSPKIAATNATRSLYLSGTPGVNWNTLAAGRWVVLITYVDYGTIFTQRNP